MEDWKQVAEIIGQLGEQGTSAFIWYLVISLVKTLVLCTAWVIGICVAFRSILKMIVRCCFLDDLRDATGMHSYETAVKHAVNKMKEPSMKERY